jgi:protein-tyrosine phosphatase
MKAQVYWVPGPWRGRLGIVPRPRGGDWLVDEVRAWREAGIDTVLTCLTPAEIGELDLQAESRCTKAEGIESLSLPIPDYGVPQSHRDFSKILRKIEEALFAGKSVAVHCRQGIGRSSVVAASALVAAGCEPEDAFRRVEAARGRPVPDTREQREWVRLRAPGLLAAQPTLQ